MAPCKRSLDCHNFCNGWSAPDITAVSKPKRKPPTATAIDQDRMLFIVVFPKKIL
jgi:hypothetical protein